MMNEKFELYKKLADDALNKLNEILDITNAQYNSVSNESTEALTQLTEKRGRIIGEFNLMCEEMDKIFSEISDNEAVLSFDKTYKESVNKLKNDVFEANKKLEKAINIDMENCRKDIKIIAKNQEALNGYGHLDYAMESAYFDKRNC